MEVAGFVIGLAPLVDLALAVKGHVHNLRSNDALKMVLQERADNLIRAFRSVPETSSEEAIRIFNCLILEDLKAVEKTLQSVITSGTGSGRVMRLIKATSDNKKLQNCRETLERLTDRVISVINEERRIHSRPAIANDMAAGPISEAGLDRASCILEFLGRSASQDLRVVCIHGLPGLGKTTLLYQVWNGASKKAPFLAQAFVQISYDTHPIKVALQISYDTHPIKVALQISYDSLPKSLQEAFLDIVEVFYGWPWDVVECIVGESNMKRLKDSSLISPVDNLWKCNPGAMAENSESMRNCLSNYGNFSDIDHFSNIDRDSWFPIAVSMHDLVFKFGKSVLHNSPSIWRSLTLKTNVKHTELQSHVENARNLQVLAIVLPSRHGNIFEYDYIEKAFSSQQGKGRLKALLLSGLNESANSIIQTLVSDEIRFMQLEYCRELRSLPDTFPLKELQVLRVKCCDAFNNFSVQGWDNLKCLFIMDCPALITVPDALASLPNLETVWIKDCDHLQEFPPLRGPHGPFELTLQIKTALI